MKLSSCAGIVGRDSVFSYLTANFVLKIFRFTLYLAAGCELVRLLILHGVLPALSDCYILAREENGHSLTTHTLSPLAVAQSSACCVHLKSQKTSVTFVELWGKKKKNITYAPYIKYSKQRYAIWDRRHFCYSQEMSVTAFFKNLTHFCRALPLSLSGESCVSKHLFHH